MTTSPVVSLRLAVRNALQADANLAGRVTGQAIYDEAPRGASTPYLTFGDISARDWSTATEKGVEHVLTIHVWSSQRDVGEAVAIAGEITRILDDAALSLEAHHLVNLRMTSIETKRENSGRFSRASLRFRAITENIS